MPKASVNRKETAALTIQMSPDTGLILLLMASPDATTKRCGRLGLVGNTHRSVKTVLRGHNSA